MNEWMNGSIVIIIVLWETESCSSYRKYQSWLEKWVALFNFCVSFSTLLVLYLDLHRDRTLLIHILLQKHRLHSLTQTHICDALPLQFLLRIPWGNHAIYRPLCHFHFSLSSTPKKSLFAMSLCYFIFTWQLSQLQVYCLTGKYIDIF